MANRTKKNELPLKTTKYQALAVFDMRCAHFWHSVRTQQVRSASVPRRIALGNQGARDHERLSIQEPLNGEIFTTLRGAQVLIENWRRHYNAAKPHSSLSYRPPTQKRTCRVLT